MSQNKQEWTGYRMGKYIAAIFKIKQQHRNIEKMKKNLVRRRKDKKKTRGYFIYLERGHCVS